MKNKTYIITGATGFVGSMLVKKLLKDGHTVFAVVRSKEKADRILGELDAKIFIADICDKEALNEAFTAASGTEIVVMHAAGIVQLSGNSYHFSQMRRANVYGTQNIIDLCLKHNAKLVYVSSVHALPAVEKGVITKESENFDPNLVKGKYSKSKAGASALVSYAVKNQNLDARMVHPSAIIGPFDTGETSTTKMVKDYLAGRIPAATKGGFDFVDIRDVVDGILKAENAPTGSSYILSGNFITAKELLDILYNLTNKKQITKTLPIWLARVGLPFLWVWAKFRKRKPVYTAYHLSALSDSSTYSNDLAKAELGFNPRSVEESLTDMLAHMLKADHKNLTN